ncbi:MAG: SelB C-terminal domain-containing protein, partial [Acidobacteriota bacterium]
MPKAELTTRLLPERARPLAPTYLKMLAQAKALVVQGDLVTQPGRKASSQMTGDEAKLSARLLEEIEAGGLTPPGPADLSIRLGTKQQILEGVQGYLLRQRQIVRLSSGLILSQKAIDGVRDVLESGGEEWERFSVPQFKDHFELSRKWAIPILEHLDSIGATRRVGNERMLIRRLR